MTKIADITGIDRIVYGAENLEDGIKFFNDWGLKQVSSDQGGAVFATQDGTEVVVRTKDDPSLPTAFEAGSTLREVVWGVSNDSELAKITSAISGEDSFRKIDGRPACTDPNGMTLSFRVTQRKDVELAATPINSPAQPDARVNAASAFYDRAEPIEVGHVVFFSTDVEASYKFYTETLGFYLSDRYPGDAVFLRCRPDGGHHNLFLLNVPNRGAGLNHVAFTVRDIHEVFGGGLHIDRCGWTTQIGPGRHPVSSAYFWYVENPCGGLAEYFADEDYLTADWQPRDFERTNENYAEWGIGGGIDGHTRRQHLPE